jgi:hypothetical protein
MISPDRKPKDQTPQLDDLLAAQTDALLADQDFRPRLETTSLDAAEKAEVYELLHLAQRLRENLTSVAPDDAFMSRLKQELVGEPAGSPSPIWLLRWRNLPPRYRFAASLGGLTLTAGLTLLATRRVLDLFGKVGQRQEPKPDQGLSFTTAT